MKGRRLLWGLYLSYVGLILCSILAIGWYSTRLAHDYYLSSTKEALYSEAVTLAATLPSSEEKLQPLAVSLKHATGKRITIITPEGGVVADSEEDPRHMDNHADRPEIVTALRGTTGSSVRFSRTLKKDLLYVAVPVREGEKITSVVRLSVPLEKVDETVLVTDKRIVTASLAILLLASLVALLVYRSMIAPLEKVKEGASRFAGGDLAFRIAVPKHTEIGELADSLNSMAIQLGERLDTVLRQRDEQNAVLSSMIEGVIALDDNEQIIRMNSAAGALLNTNPEDAKGRTVAEVIRSASLQRFIRMIHTSHQSLEEEIVILDPAERFVRAYGRMLAGNPTPGMLVVLHDVTRMRHLENIRRDFVANVSHELKTPITSIKGFVETLLEGALSNPDDAKRFLEIIRRHADRLNRIFEDLLSLARLEDEKVRGELTFETVPLKPVLESAVQICEEKATEKGVSISISCSPFLEAHINASLLEQALVNLISNGIEYSDPGSSISVRGYSDRERITIEVQDTGYGIESSHLSRLFERFYRVDRARARKSGGTGLGLAIVKHISQIHGGYPEVESSLGKGSLFRIHLPLL